MEAIDGVGGCHRSRVKTLRKDLTSEPQEGDDDGWGAVEAQGEDGDILVGGVAVATVGADYDVIEKVDGASGDGVEGGTGALAREATLGRVAWGQNKGRGFGRSRRQSGDGGGKMGKGKFFIGGR